MKILIIHNYYQQAGGERVAVEAQHALLTKRGHDVILHTRDNAAIEQFSPIDKLQSAPRTVYNPREYAALQALIRREAPDIAHVHNVFPLISPAAYPALHDAGVPVVQTLHNFRLMCPNGLFYTQGEVCERCKMGNTLHAIRWRCYRDSYPLSALYAAAIGLGRRRGTFQLVDRFIALNAFTAHKLTESGIAGPEQIAVLGNFLPDPVPDAGDFNADAPYLLYIGRLASEKGVAVLLKAMTALPDMTLKIAGSGPQMPHLQSLAEELSLHNVTFLGRVEGQAKWELLRHALATVVPSVCYENMPYTVLESMAAGTPVIASRLGGLPYVITQGEDGMLFDANDTEGLVTALTTLIVDPALARTLGRTARQTFEQSYTADAHYQQLMAIYHDLV